MASDTSTGPPTNSTLQRPTRKRARGHTEAEASDHLSKERSCLLSQDNTDPVYQVAQSQSLHDSEGHQLDNSGTNDMHSVGSDASSENDSFEKSFQVDGKRDDGDLYSATDADDPQHQLENFDWRELEKQYSTKMAQLSEREHDIFMNFHSLCAVRPRFVA